MAVTVVAAYDVRDDPRRARLAAMLQAHGDRIQKSVFVLSLSPEEVEDIKTKAQDIINVNTDSLWLMRQCKGCWETLIQVGQATRPEKVLLWTVM